MATITLDRPWLLDTAAPSVALPVLFTDDRELDDQVDGEVRRYANGTLRAVRRAGSRRTLSMVVSVDAAGLETLRGWRGRTLLYRDGLGARWAGTFFAMPHTPWRDGRGYDVDIDLVEVTWDEAV